MIHPNQMSKTMKDQESVKIEDIYTLTPKYGFQGISQQKIGNGIKLERKKAFQPRVINLAMSFRNDGRSQTF